MKKNIKGLFALPILFALSVSSCKKNDPGVHIDPGAPSVITISSDAALAFPGAEGFGQKATGGRTGKVWKVTNLNDNGPGSLREAVNAVGARIIIFNVSGTITLNSKLSIDNDSITIAGQTAPGDGITIRKYPVFVNANNVIIRYIRFRLGDEVAKEANAISGYDKTNIIIDHCSLSWSTNDVASFYNNTNFTFEWSIIAESFKNPSIGRHGYGGMWGGKNASFHHNLIANNDSRNPRFSERPSTNFAHSDLVDFRNNVIYNWGSNSISGGEDMRINLVNNYYKPGPGTAAAVASRIFSPDHLQNVSFASYWGKYYILGNVIEGKADATTDNWTYGVMNQFNPAYGNIPVDSVKVATAYSINSNVTTHDAATAYLRVLAYSGASLVRDAVDTRIVTNTTNGTFTGAGSNGSVNGFIDSQTDVGGWPALTSKDPAKDTDGDGMPDDWEISKNLDPNFYNPSYKNLSTAYDNIEVYINSLVAPITTAQVQL